MTRRIRRKCGHVETCAVTSPQHTRQSVIVAELRARSCDDCYRATLAAVLEDIDARGRRS